MSRARGANARLHGKFEATYGTPPSGNYIKFPFVSANIGPEQGLIESDLLGQGRETYDSTLDVVNNDGDIVVPVDARNFGHWLNLLLGAATTTIVGGGPNNSHVFSSGAASLPAMSIETALPDVPSYEMNYGMRANTMKIDLSRRGLLNATIGMIGKGANARAGSSGAGTPTSLAVSRMAQATGQIKKDGTQLGSIVSASLSFSNNLDKVETIQPNSEIEDADPGQATAMGNITARFKDTALMDLATGHTPLDLSFGWTVGTFSLIFDFQRVLLPRPKVPITGPAGIQASFDWQGSGASGPVMTATLVNDVAAYAAAGISG
jgi:hypothetical protein